MSTHWHPALGSMASLIVSGEPRRKVGFTLIELITVMAIVALLLTLAVPRYFNSIDRSKETVLQQSLNVMRDAIDKYYADNAKYPESLETLETSKYLRKVPVDPITNRVDTWIIVEPADPKKGNVYDVRSGAPGAGSDGKPYREW